MYGPPQPPTAVVRVGFAVRRHDHLRPFRRHHRLQPAHHQDAAQADESAEEGVCVCVCVCGGGDGGGGGGGVCVCVWGGG